MKLNFKITERGVCVRLSNKNFYLNYPIKVWNDLSLEEKRFFLDNITYLETVCVPLVAGFKSVNYNTSKPFLMKEINGR